MSNHNDTSNISFTAHYTGFVWHYYGLSRPEFATQQGHLYFQLLRPIEFVARHIIGSDIRTTLLQRHALIDHLLEAQLAQYPDTQVIELACGLSPRGFRMTEKYPQLHYIEADLPGMAARKKSLLAQLPAHKHHRVVVCNILEMNTPESIESVVLKECDSSKPVVIITEGLVNYFDLATISSVWKRMNNLLKSFPNSAYISDVYPEVSHRKSAGFIKQANKSLKLLSRSDFCLHFNSDFDIEKHFKACGFSQVTVLNPDTQKIPMPKAKGGAIVRVFLAQA